MLFTPYSTQRPLRIRPPAPQAVLKFRQCDGTPRTINCYGKPILNAPRRDETGVDCEANQDPDQALTSHDNPIASVVRRGPRRASPGGGGAALFVEARTAGQPSRDRGDHSSDQAAKKGSPKRVPTASARKIPLSERHSATYRENGPGYFVDKIEDGELFPGGRTVFH